MFKVSAKVTNPKHISGEDRKGEWRAQGHDAVKTTSTSFSRREEWCIAESSQCRLISKAIIYYGKKSVTDEDFVAISKAGGVGGGNDAKKKPTCPGRSNWGRHHPPEDGERVQCPFCKEFRCSNCIPVHLANCRGWSFAGMTRK